MATRAELLWQPTLLGAAEPGFDPALPGLERRELSDGAWLDVATGVVAGADQLFDDVLSRGPWTSRRRPMYDRIVDEPRLTSGRLADLPALVAHLGDALSTVYGTDLGSVSANLYRDGRDSVAWHGDRIGRVRSRTVVAIVSLGSPRRFLLRPRGGGPSVRLEPAPGDLLVMGGTCQRTWEHCVPKCRAAGPRISLMFREPLSDA